MEIPGSPSSVASPSFSFTGVGSIPQSGGFLSPLLLLLFSVTDLVHDEALSLPTPSQPLQPEILIGSVADPIPPKHMLKEN